MTPDVPDMEEDFARVEAAAARRRRLLRQFSKVARASLGTGLMGTLFTFPSVIVEDLNRHPTSIYGTPLNIDGLQDLVGSLLMLSSLPGAWLIAAVAMRLGRRMSMMVCGGLAVVGWLGVALVPFPAGILVSRCVSGLALGGLSVVINAYVVELADVDVRGMMSMCLNLAILLGQVYTVALGYLARYYTVAFFNALVPAAFVLFLVWLPESPSLLVLKGKDEKATSVLLDLRGSKADVRGEISSYRSFNQPEGKEEEAAWRKLLQPSVIKNLLICSSLYIIVAFTGFLVINANAIQMFKAAGTTVDADLAAIVLMLVQFAGGIAGFFLMDKIGRKNILYVGLILMTLALALMTGYTALRQNSLDSANNTTKITTTTTTTTTTTITDATTTTLMPDDVETISHTGTMEIDDEEIIEGGGRGGNGGEEREGGWIPLAALVVSQTGVSLGVNVMPFILNQEYFPTAIRSQACGVCFTVWTLATFVILQVYTPMVNTLTQAGLYGTYMSVCLVGLGFTALFVRETMGEAVG